MSDKSIQSLGEISTLNRSHLEKLTLDKSNIADRGVQYLADRLKRNTIKSVILTLNYRVGNNILPGGYRYYFQ